MNLGQELWTNIREEPLRNGERLGKGEQIRYNGTTLVLQSVDGNLVLYDGIASDDTVLWAANAIPESNFHDFYAKVTDDGYLQLVGIDHQYGNEEVYFHENLFGVNAWTNLECFTAEYDGEGGMMGVPCQ